MLSIATAALAFTVIAAREWGPAARWSSRSFAVVWAGVVLSGAYPFALGATFALLALWALQSRGRLRFAVLTVLCFAASPLAFALLVLVLAAIGLARLPARVELTLPVVTVELSRRSGSSSGASSRPAAASPSRSRSWPRSACSAFSASSSRGGCRRRACSGGMYVLYLPVCMAAFLVPSAWARTWRGFVSPPFARDPDALVAPVAAAPTRRGAFLLALSWNVSPLAASYAKGLSDPASQEAYWAPAIGSSTAT